MSDEVEGDVTKMEEGVLESEERDQYVLHRVDDESEIGKRNTTNVTHIVLS